MSDESEKPEKFVNPIDKDKVTDRPGLLPYAHHVGSVKITAPLKEQIQNRAITAMYEQTDKQLNQIREQIEKLVSQANSIVERKETSEKIYQADMGFKPMIGETYYLYQRENSAYLLSLLSPSDWGAKLPYTYIQTVRLLADHTWDIIESSHRQSKPN